MLGTAKTIQIFLPDGSPRGIKIADITSRIVKAIQIPRNRLEDGGKREETHNVGVYFLFGQSDEDSKPRVYIGEAENCFERIKQHNKEKDFWDTAVIVTTSNNTFTKAHIKYLESYSYEQCNQIGRYKMKQTIPTKPYLPEPIIADLMDIFETMKILLSTLGFHIFEETRERKEDELNEYFYCRGKGVEAVGDYTDEGFVVFKDSQMVIDSTNGMKTYLGLRTKLINDKQVLKEGNYYKFVSDYIFKSPSAASAVILGRPSNGWMDWKNKDGKTLDELKRKI